MARRIYNIDPYAFPFYRRGFGQYCNAAFTFKVIAVHRPLGHGLIGPKSAGLLQQFVDQCGFTMINMGDDRNIAQIHLWRP